MEENKSATSGRQPTTCPLSKEALAAAGPQQVKLMLESEVAQLEDYYCGQGMPRNLALAISIRNRTLAEERGPGGGEVKRRLIGRVEEVMPGSLAEGADVLSRKEALEVFVYLSAAFQRFNGVDADVNTVKTFTEFQRSWPGRKLQTACAGSRVNASDVFWSFVAEWSHVHRDRVKCELKRPGGMVMWNGLHDSSVGGVCLVVCQESASL